MQYFWRWYVAGVRQVLLSRYCFGDGTWWKRARSCYFGTVVAMVRGGNKTGFVISVLLWRQYVAEASQVLLTRYGCGCGTWQKRDRSCILGTVSAAVRGGREISLVISVQLWRQYVAEARHVL